MFQKASPKHRRLIVLAFGPTGSGKTIFALTFPKAKVIDLERGTIHYEGRSVIPEQAADFEVFRTGSALDVTKAAEYLIDEFNKSRVAKTEQPCETIVIDPMTIFWDRLQEAYIEKKRKGNDFDTDLSFRDWGPIKRPLKNLLTDFLNLPVNFVMTAHEGNEYEMKGKELTVVGQKAKTEGSVPYATDVVLQFLEQSAGGGNNVKCVKDRTGVLKPGQVYKNVNYGTWAKYLEGTSTQPEAAPVDRPTGDGSVFDQDDVNSAEGSAGEVSELVSTILADKDCIRLMDELDWAPAKRRAMLKRFSNIDEAKKFIGDTVRIHRSEHRSR